MELMTHEHERTFIPAELASNRRRSPRLGGQFGLTFSGVDKGRMIMGDGRILNVSQKGIGVHGDRSLTSGMELALFIELPDSEDYLCIPEARVSWVKGRRFGVSLRTMKPDDHNRLRYFLQTHEQQKPV